MRKRCKRSCRPTVRCCSCVPRLAGRRFPSCCGTRAPQSPVYRTENQEGLRARLSAKEVDAAIFASGSAVRGFARVTEGCGLSGLPAICIGAQTAAVAAQQHMTIHTAKAATIDSLVDCALEVLAEGDIK